MFLLFLRQLNTLRINYDQELITINYNKNQLIGINYNQVNNKINNVPTMPSELIEYFDQGCNGYPKKNLIPGISN